MYCFLPTLVYSEHSFYLFVKSDVRKMFFCGHFIYVIYKYRLFVFNKLSFSFADFSIGIFTFFLLIISFFFVFFLSDEVERSKLWYCS